MNNIKKRKLTDFFIQNNLTDINYKDIHVLKKFLFLLKVKFCLLGVMGLHQKIIEN
jgi:ribosomal protein S18